MCLDRLTCEISRATRGIESITADQWLRFTGISVSLRGTPSAEEVLTRVFRQVVICWATQVGNVTGE